MQAAAAISHRRRASGKPHLGTRLVPGHHPDRGAEQVGREIGPLAARRRATAVDVGRIRLPPPDRSDQTCRGPDRGKCESAGASAAAGIDQHTAGRAQATTRCADSGRHGDRARSGFEGVGALAAHPGRSRPAGGQLRARTQPRCRAGYRHFICRYLSSASKSRVCSRCAPGYGGPRRPASACARRSCSAAPRET